MSKKDSDASHSQEEFPPKASTCLIFGTLWWIWILCTLALGVHAMIVRSKIELIMSVVSLILVFVAPLFSNSLTRFLDTYDE